jgi:long-chain fatty acid transport protein
MNTIKKSFNPLLTISVACSSLFAAQVQASGFALTVQSASAQGMSYAGAAIKTDDASVMWFNAAQLTQINKNQLIAALHFVSPKVKFVDQGTAIGGGNSDGGNLGIVPNLYWKSQINDTHIGLGINVPFGQHLDYGETWAGRYHATETNLKTLQINPNMAHQINQAWSVGFGLNAQYVDVLLAQKAPITNVGDLDIKITGDNWAYGYNLGLSYHPKNAPHFGVSYRSGISHRVKGKSTSLIPAYNTPATADVNLPANAAFAASYPLNTQTTLYADAVWTQWSAYDQLVVDFANSSSNSESKQNFKDAWRYAIGGDYQANAKLKLRTGIALDKTPVPNPQSRSPRTPDSDRYWFSVGMGYQFTRNLNLDLAYSHLYADKAELDYPPQTVNPLKGKMDAAVNILSAQLVWHY